MAKRKKHQSVLAFGGLVLLGFLIYSVVLFKNSTYEQQGFITCNKENTLCEESKHIHADIEVSLCGRDIQFAKEKGHTDKQHTHKERNKIHWHARIPVDPKTQEYTDPAPRMLNVFFEQMELVIPSSCPSSLSSTLTVLVNNGERKEGLNYIWQDGDAIRVIVD